MISNKSKPFGAENFEEAAFLTPKVQCFKCKGYGHVARNCKTKIFSNYCKKNGHIDIISECTRRPQKKNYQPRQKNQTALQAQVADEAAASTEMNITHSPLIRFVI